MHILLYFKVLFFYELSLSLYTTNCSNILILVNYTFLYIFLKLNLFFVIYINFNNFNFDIIINYFYNSLDYNFYIFYKILSLFSFNNFFIININIKNYKSLNILQNNYIEDFMFNKLLENKLQHIHPLLFLILINLRLYNYEIFELNKYLLSTILLIFFIFLGLNWSNQNSFWNSWWIWDISELYIFFIINYFIFFIHIKLKPIYYGLITFFSIYIENILNLFYDLICNFYIKSHEFISINVFKYLSYWLLYLVFINDFKYFYAVNMKLKINIKNLIILKYTLMILILINSIAKNFTIFYFIAQYIIIFYFILLFSFFVFFTGIVIFLYHFYFVFILVYLKFRLISNIEINNITTNSLNNININFENLSIYVYNFKLNLPVSIFNNTQSINLNFLNSNMIYRFNLYTNIINNNKGGENVFFFFWLTVLNIFLKKIITLKYL